jgi:arylsulfatase A-like enzyme
MLLSGTDNHIAGLGAMWEQMRATPDIFARRRGYEGYLNFDVAALPEVMSDNGYFTVMSGKWHLGMKRDVAPAARGFQKVFTYLAGAGNHFNNEPQLEEGIPRLPSLCGDGLWMEDDHFLNRKTDLPDDFYSTKSFTDKMLEYLQARTAGEREKPFFAYLPYTAPHWPLQAPPEVISKFRGWYEDGPLALRERRLQNLRELGLVPPDIEPAPIVDLGTSSWANLAPKQQQRSSRAMEIFAAMVDQIDHHLGRVLGYLRETDELDDTAVLFLSDNGAEGCILEAVPVLAGASLADVIARHYDNELDNMGTASSCVWYGPQWASAATAPSRAFKAYATEGGIRCPCISRWPPRHLPQSPRNVVCHSFTTVMDIMPTILDLAEISHPGMEFRGRSVVPMRGRSWRPLLTDPAVEIYDPHMDYTSWELFGVRAVRKGDWKALYQVPPKGQGQWELYNLAGDPGEIQNRAAKEPEILRELIEHYEVYYQETGMFDASLAIEMAEKAAAAVLGNYKA